MAYQVLIKDSAQKELAVFPFSIQKRIDTRILSLAENPLQWSQKVGRGENLYRLRVGDHRIIYQIQDKALLVLMVKVGHRRELYRQR
jgi:mRNA interferase RelE/StbE